MVEIVRGNLFDAGTEALVNTVNCDGFMGKGIALQFKKAFPENFRAYEKACRAGKVAIGRMFVFRTGGMLATKYIINFPTKRHWRENSRMEDVEAGLKALVGEIRRLGISSVALPPLGCGLGGLDWGRVRALIERALAEVPGVRAVVYQPAGAPAAGDMPVGTKRPALTIPRALFLRLMEQYDEMAYRLTLLEIQKLAYFLQEAGEPLRLRYEEGLYGPYAHNLNKVLETLEGHYIRGYGDNQRPDVEVGLLPGAAEEARRFLAGREAPNGRLARVGLLIEGFETPYGMELLSSVHWTAARRSPPAGCADEAVQAVQGWNERKRGMFSPEHVRIAWARLGEQGWISRP